MFLQSRDISSTQNRRSRWIFACLSVLLIGISLQQARGDELPWSQRMADSTIKRWPQGKYLSEDKPWVWNYELGVLLQGMDDVWYHTADAAYYTYIKESIDPFINKDGSISTYKPENNQLDDLVLGRELLLLYGVTQDAKYYKAATLLRQPFLLILQAPSHTRQKRLKRY